MSRNGTAMQLLVIGAGESVTWTQSTPTSVEIDRLARRCRVPVFVGAATVVLSSLLLLGCAGPTEPTGNGGAGGGTPPAPGSCTFSISPTSVTVAAAGATGTVAVTAGSGCSWTAASNDAWITVTGGASGTGNGTVSYSVAANTASQRTGTVTIAGQTFTVTQEGAPSLETSLADQIRGTFKGLFQNPSLPTAISDFEIIVTKIDDTSVIVSPVSGGISSMFVANLSSEVSGSVTSIILKAPSDILDTNGTFVAATGGLSYSYHLGGSDSGNVEIFAGTKQ